MSKSRREPDVRGYSVTHPPGRATLPIEPGWHQLLYAASGVMTISTATGAWAIPPHRALWIPDSAAATIANRSRVAVRTLYLSSDLPALPCKTRAITVSGLVRELLLHAVKTSPLDLSKPVDAALITVLMDQLKALPDAPLLLPLPQDPRAADAARVLMDDPTLSLDDVRVGASSRTLERAFAAETGLTLGGWHRRARILHSLDSLASGGSVTAAASAAGYATPSAYVAAFKQELGETPRRFLS
ncbi:AraC family transcriptional regulator [Fodinicola feengrottensis]|uniref:Helix-turn-helix transcriptional regulator n=1 Tax=Fodinicola feengrottensis TaxID=435914 RepID=A0ABP4V3B4_9ACTN|nr:helix-turn-helix domain-containing protein [Fodinicola feengrottensis]